MGESTRRKRVVDSDELFWDGYSVGDFGGYGMGINTYYMILACIRVPTSSGLIEKNDYN